MNFFTLQECEQWLSDRGRNKPDQIARPCVSYPHPDKPYQLHAVAHWLADSISREQPVLLWITEWGIWPSSENWHLYYRLRQSNSDSRTMVEAPGHLFLADEQKELVTFLQLAFLNGWDGFILTQANRVNVFFSHDEYFDFYADSDEELKEVKEFFTLA